MEVSWDLCLNVGLIVLLLLLGWFHLGRTAAGQGDTGTCTAPQDPTQSPSRSSSAAVPHKRAASGASAADSAAAVGTKTEPKQGERYHGLVKRYSDRNGMGFITCDVLRAKHGVDVRVYRDEYEAAGLQVADAVAFHVSLGGRPGCPKNHPWASGVSKLKGRVEATGAASASSSSLGSMLAAAEPSAEPSEVAPADAIAAAASTATEDVPSGMLNAAATEFVPTKSGQLSGPCPGLNAAAPVFVPAANAG
mmetsp:Transcript_8660/g.19808  ORF Transcript_8660/g.19808 Transcript_8660/m.19808 type:complete len:250 (+) Transcript_8660:128-877(+)